MPEPHRPSIAGRETGLSELTIAIERSFMAAMAAAARRPEAIIPGAFTAIILQLGNVLALRHPEWHAGVMAALRTPTMAATLAAFADEIVQRYPLSDSTGGAPDA